MDNYSIILNIKRIRSKRNISQKTLAELIGMSASNYAKVESGRIRLVSETLEKIAGALDLSLEELLTGSSPRKTDVEILEDVRAEYESRIRNESSRKEDEIAGLKKQVGILTDQNAYLKNIIKSQIDTIAFLESRLSEK